MKKGSLVVHEYRGLAIVFKPYLLKNWIAVKYLTPNYRYKKYDQYGISKNIRYFSVNRLVPHSQLKVKV